MSKCGAICEVFSRVCGYFRPCGAICEVFSRVCGYFRPVTNWNKGKQEEFKERKVFEVKKYARKNPDGKSSAGV